MGLREFVHAWILLPGRGVHFLPMLQQGWSPLRPPKELRRGPRGRLCGHRGRRALDPEHGIRSQETHVVGPAQPLASMISDLFALLEGGHARAVCTSRVTQREDRTEALGKCLAHSTPSMVLGSVSISRCLALPGLPKHLAGSASAQACLEPRRNPGTSGWLSDFHAFPRAVSQILFTLAAQ